MTAPTSYLLTEEGRPLAATDEQLVARFYDVRACSNPSTGAPTHMRITLMHAHARRARS